MVGGARAAPRAPEVGVFCRARKKWGLQRTGRGTSAAPRALQEGLAPCCVRGLARKMWGLFPHTQEAGARATRARGPRVQKKGGSRRGWRGPACLRRGCSRRAAWAERGGARGARTWGRADPARSGTGGLALWRTHRKRGLARHIPGGPTRQKGSAPATHPGRGARAAGRRRRKWGLTARVPGVRARSGGSRHICRKDLACAGGRTGSTRAGSGCSCRGAPARWKRGTRAARTEKGGRALHAMGEVLILHVEGWGLAPLPVKGREAIGLPRGAQRV